MKTLETLRDFEAFAVYASGPFGFISTGAKGVHIHQTACRWQNVSLFHHLADYYAATFPAAA